MSTLFKRSNGVYYISYTESGIRKQQSTGERNKTDALRKLDSFEQPQSAKLTKPSLQNFIKDFLEDAESSAVGVGIGCRSVRQLLQQREVSRISK